MANPHVGGERTIYQDATVTITTSRAVIAGTTYAMANITSVREVKEASGAGCIAVMGVAGFVAGGVVILGGATALGLVIMVFAGLLGAAAYFGNKPKHWVCI